MMDDDDEPQEPTNREWALQQLAGAAGWECGKLAREEDLGNLFVFFDGLATKAALKRKEEILGMLRWKYATDPFFSISSKLRLRLAGDGACQVVCVEAAGGGAPELLCSTRPVDVPMETSLQSVDELEEGQGLEGRVDVLAVLVLDALAERDVLHLGSKRVRNSQLQRLISRPHSARFG